MSYLLDKKIQRKKYKALSVIVLVLLFLFYFSSSFFGGLAYVGNRIFHPFWVVGGETLQNFSNIGAFFVSKNTLVTENENLRAELEAEKLTMANYNSVLDENTSLKEILGRKNEKVSMTLAAILAKPNQSPYDTLIVDAGSDQGVKTGSRVFALGNIPVGRVADVYPKSSKIILFSNSGEKTSVLLSGKAIPLEAVGRGGGNFDVIIPRDLVVAPGDSLILPGIYPFLLGSVQSLISDPRDPFTKALVTSPVNIEEIKFVQIEKNF